MASTPPTALLPDCFLLRDTCNVFLLRRGDEAVAFDFGSGAWMSQLDRLGVRNLRHVFLTHAHRDQCAGLAAWADWPFQVHISPEDLRFYRPDTLQAFWRDYQAGGCPANYAAPRQPMPFVKGDVGQAAEVQWAGAHICAVPTPGHTRGALTYLVNWHGRAIAFCGDAVHAGGTVHQPFHLEWDHWTPEGALAAWHGLQRLGYCRIDLLCPSHGPVVPKRAATCIRTAQRRLMRFIEAKGSVCTGERDHWLTLEPLGGGASRVLPHLYHFGGNSFLLVGRERDGLVVDPTLPSIEALPALIEEIGVRTVSAATTSHYHRDHSDGLNWLRGRFGTSVWLHPWVAEPIRDRDRFDRPWMTADSVLPDRVLPEAGSFRWDRYRFRVQPFPGQTWWHCAFHTQIDGLRVLFSGDNYQPPSRWNGTGGFCAYNGSRFAGGFARSAQAVLDVAPEVIANGHACIYRYSPSQYRRILRWSVKAERAVADLCPSTDWLADYDCHWIRWEPFRSSVRSGQALSLSLVATNHRSRDLSLECEPVGPEDWTFEPGRRRSRLKPGGERKIRFAVRVPANAEAGRRLIAADIVVDGRPIGEAAVALIDITAWN